MNYAKAAKKAQKLYGIKVRYSVDERCVTLSGETDDWQKVVAVGKLFVDKKSGRHVVNDVVLKGYVEKKEYLPSLFDDKLDGTAWDAVIIGGGIIGCAVARELSRNKLKILLVEKHSDVAMGASGANDGMVHAGIDLKGKSLKLCFGPKGNAMYDEICGELGVPFKRDGQYVVFTSRLIKLLANSYLVRAKKHGIPNVSIISKKETDRVEHTVSSYSKGALKAATTGAVSPYKLTIAYAENAVSNNVTVSLDTAVTDMKVDDGRITEITTNRGVLTSKLVINCAGVFSDRIAAMAGDRYFSIHPRKGTDLLLDKNSSGLPSNNISLAPTLKTLKENKNTKGGGIIKTADGNILLGPDAVETPDREDTSTARENIERVFAKQKQCCPSLQRSAVIAYFSGVRACTYEEDFIAETSTKVKNLIHLAGIQSPGVTAAPALAKYAERLAVKCLTESGETVVPNEKFTPVRHPLPVFNELSDDERAELIAKNPDYGKIVCRCEEVSLGEVKDALCNPLGVTTVDGVKRRTRAGMGRCQGGFCRPTVMRTVSSLTGVPLTDVRKGDEGSNFCYFKLKETYDDDK